MQKNIENDMRDLYGLPEIRGGHLGALIEGSVQGSKGLSYIGIGIFIQAPPPPIVWKIPNLVVS